MITFSQFPLSYYTLVTCLAKNSLYIVLCRFFLLLDVLIYTSMITVLTSLIECWSTILISSSDMTSWYRAIMGSWWRTSCLDQYIGIDVRLYLQCSLDNALGLCKPENIHYRKNQKGKKSIQKLTLLIHIHINHGLNERYVHQSGKWILTLHGIVYELPDHILISSFDLSWFYSCMIN